VWYSSDVDFMGLRKEAVMKLFCGSGSGVERLLAKEKVAGSNPVSRSRSLPGDVAKWLRRGSAKPLSAVRIRPSPPFWSYSKHAAFKRK
jgi:hypothetical protein